jgi:hypothetical protein
MHKDTMHMTPQLYHSRCMDILLGWYAQNMHSHIAFTCGMHRLGNFVWETSNIRSFLYTHATHKIHQHDTTQANNSSNSVDVKLCIMQLVCVQNIHSVMSGKMRMVDFRLISCPQRMHAYLQHNTTSPTCIHKGNQCKSHMVDDIYT